LTCVGRGWRTGCGHKTSDIAAPGTTDPAEFDAGEIASAPKVWLIALAAAPFLHGLACGSVSFSLGSQSDGCEHCAREPEAEVPQRLPARDRLGQVFGQFIEFVIHRFAFILMLVGFVLVA